MFQMIFKCNKKGAVGIDQAALDADPAVFSQPAEQRQ
jgi:hypothetical protein